MAHFCELDENNMVLRVVVISNEDIIDENGNENEQLGIDLCTRLFGTTRWVQTSYNHNFRKTYAGVGCFYSPTADCFYSPDPPYPSWTLDENYDWQPPTPKPAEGNYYWDEDTTTWIPVE